MEHILITGASGFVGKEVVARLAAAGHKLTLVGRQATSLAATSPHRYIGVGEISSRTPWGKALEGCTTVVHLAGQVPGAHVDENRMRIVNDEATAALARQSAESGVRRFVLMSSILAVTDNASRKVITDATTPAPASPYGRSKQAAECHVADFNGSGRTGISLRPVMVYGAAASGNWRLLQKLAASGLPLPFGATRNRRSMVGVRNLASAVAAVVAKGAEAPAGAFAVADVDPVSLAEVLRLLREGMSLPSRVVPVPPILLSGLLQAAGKGRIASSLFGDLVVDASGFRKAFSWGPVETIKDGIRRSGMEFATAH